LELTVLLGSIRAIRRLEMTGWWRRSGGRRPNCQLLDTVARTHGVLHAYRAHGPHDCAREPTTVRHDSCDFVTKHRKYQIKSVSGEEQVGVTNAPTLVVEGGASEILLLQLDKCECCRTSA
jgi:hypothetical protein